ncbi:toll-like receptor 3 [Anopheles cruzii]|uniref:toll-like receptor 3 n=1 Tax=Anopheles cruzii TaxID=68878 RepID=UPI0022EC7EA3|nr:toll-like receptor 3 [Anopheles cruzii]
MTPHSGVTLLMLAATCLLLPLTVSFSSHVEATAHGEQRFALLDCPPECMCNRVSEKSVPKRETSDAQQQNDTSSDVGSDSDDATSTVHALCMVGQGASFVKIEDLLSLDTSVLKLIYTSQTERYQLNASNLERFAQLRQLHIQSVNPHLLRFDIDASLPVERLHLESLELIRSELPNVLDRIVPSMAELGLQPPLSSGQEQAASAYEIVDHEQELVNDEHANTLIETFELEIVPYEVYKRDMASTNNVSFYGWNNLTELFIHDCRLDSLHPDFLYGLERLQRLSLQHNTLKVLPPFAFYGAPNVRLLSLANNRLLEVSYYSLAGLLELQVLDLSANNISKVSELTFPPFPKLAKLDLRENPIEYVFDSSFVIANMTRSLFIGSATVGLQVATPKPFQGLAQMEVLEIRNLQLDSLNQYLFRGLRALRTLRLLDGNISFVEYDSFAEMKNLTDLQAIRCAIGAISMDAFFGVKRLRTIDLSYNLLTELPVGLFDEQLQLVELYLHGNQLTQLPSEFFRRLAPAVQLVRLTDNPWLCSCAMSDWRQATTNRLKVATGGGGGPPAFIYSNKLTPRCSDPTHQIHDRSVYYVIRKNLPCNVDEGKYAKIALRISELNRRKQLMLLQQRNAARHHGSHGTAPVNGAPPAPAFVPPMAGERHRSLLYEEKRRRLLQKKLQKGHHQRGEADDHRHQQSPPQGQQQHHRIVSNELEY